MNFNRQKIVPVANLQPRQILRNFQCMHSTRTSDSAASPSDESGTDIFSATSSEEYFSPALGFPNLVLIFSIFASLGKSTHQIGKLSLLFALVHSTSAYSWTGTCGVECWLNGLVINIPDQKIFTPKGDEFDINGLTCQGLTLSRINSKYQPPLSMSVGITGVGISCDLGWAFYEKAWPHLSGKGTASAVVGGSSADLTLELMQGSDGLATGAALPTCQTDIQITSIEVKGPKILDVFFVVFKGLIKSALQKEIDKVACSEAKTMVETNLTAAILDIDRVIRPYLHPAPLTAVMMAQPGNESQSTDDSVALEDDGLLGVAEYVLDWVMGPGGPVSLNFLIDRFTKGTGNFSLSQLNVSVPHVTVALGTLGNVTLGIKDLEVSGLNSWSAIDVLRPVGGAALVSHTELDRLFVNVTFSVNVTTGHDVVRGVETLYEEGRLVADMRNLTLAMKSLLKVAPGVLGSLSGNQIECIPCLLSALRSVNTSAMHFNLSVPVLEILSLGDGSSDQLALDIDQTVDEVLDLFTKSFGPVIPVFLSGMATGPAQSTLNTFLTTTLETAKEKSGVCVEPIAEDYVQMNTSVLLIVSVAVGAVLFGLVALQYGFGPAYKNGRSRTESHVPDLEENFLEKKASTPCLFYHPDIHPVFRIGIPIIILANVALFLVSNTSGGAGVAIYLTDDGSTVRLPSLFDFTLKSSVHDMWQAGVYPLSILIALFSGAWPYVKMLLMLLVWFLPSQVLSVRKREFFLMFLDAMGKWSMIDSYVLTLMQVAFNLRLQVPPGSPGSPSAAKNFVVDVNVIAEFGFYSFLFATISSLIITHIVLAFHRHASSSSRRRELDRLEARGKAEPLCLHGFRLGKHRVRCTMLGRILVTLLILASLALLVVGGLINSFAFTFEGLTGLVLQFIGQPTYLDFSLLSLGIAIPGTTPDPSAPGVRSLQVVYFLFVLVMPALLLISLLVLWLVPLKPRVQRHVYVATEVFNAWAGLEVFVVSIIAALLEVRQFAQFIIGTKCDLINEILHQFFNADLNGDDKCFDVIAVLATGCWYLFASCVIYLSTGYIVIRLCHKVLEEREDKAFSSPPIPQNVDSPDASSQTGTTEYSSTTQCDPDEEPPKIGVFAGLFVEIHDRHQPLATVA